MSLSIEALRQRKSHSKLAAPYPNEAEIQEMIAVACTVPDHGSLKPYRFIAIGPDHKPSLAKAFQASILSGRDEVADKVLEKVADKAYAAPLQIYLIYAPILGHKIPEWEQHATAACTGYALTLAAEALGYSAIWKSFAYSDEEAFREYLGLAPHEKNLGWVNLGTSTGDKPERSKFDAQNKVELRI